MRCFARSRRRAAATAAGAALAVGLWAAPAAAHVAVSADNAQAGATRVTLTFVGEAESSTAGIRSERVVLPAGITPADVTVGKFPAGWRFTANPDGFTVGGKALPVGKDATFSVRVAKLPADQTRLSFKTLETYGDGSVSRWIEIQQPGEPEPDNPAPLLKLKPAAAAPPSPAASSGPGPAPAVDASTGSSPTGSSPTSSPAALPQSAPVPARDSGSAGWWLALGAALVLAAAAGAVLVRRRRHNVSPPA